jgi:hypothetical protein
MLPVLKETTAFPAGPVIVRPKYCFRPNTGKPGEEIINIGCALKAAAFRLLGLSMAPFTLLQSLTGVCLKIPGVETAWGQQ